MNWFYRFPGFRLSCALFCCGLWMWSIPNLADQNDPRLNELFNELHLTRDLQRGDSLTGEIWEIWIETEDPIVEEFLSQAMVAMGANDLTLALKYLNQVVGEAPQFAEGWNKRATVYYLMGEYENSIQDIRETLLLEPRHFGAIAGLGWILLQQREYAMAERVLNRALSVNPFLMNVRRQLDRLIDLNG